MKVIMDNNLTEKQLAELGLQNHLFVDGWQMEGLYESCLTYSEGLGIHMIMEGHEPIAACILYLDDGMLNVFVKKEYRGKGYGKKIIQETLEKYGKKIYQVYGTYGIEHSKEFYHGCGVAYFHDGDIPASKEDYRKYREGQMTLQDIREKAIRNYLETLAKETTLNIKSRF